MEYHGYPAFCPPAEIPSDQKINIALLYVAHAAADYLNSRSVDTLTHPFLDDYLRLLRFDKGIEEVAKTNLLDGLRTKSNRLPDFIRKRIALNRLSGSE